eukprot:COSAG05_NODE_188_length_14697_cov_11.861145_2_plen_338_part_00
MRCALCRASASRQPQALSRQAGSRCCRTALRLYPGLGWAWPPGMAPVPTHRKRWRVPEGRPLSFRIKPDTTLGVPQNTARTTPPAPPGSLWEAQEAREGWILATNGYWLPTQHMELVGPEPAGGTVLELVFGYGSIISPASRKSSGADAPAYMARLRPSFGHTRAWNFRKNTGFTALGLKSLGEDAQAATPVCGVVFPVAEALSALDEREVGYERVEVPLCHITITPLAPAEGEPEPKLSVEELTELLREGRARVWTYVPCAECSFEANLDFPICQTYVDTVRIPLCVTRRAPHVLAFTIVERFALQFNLCFVTRAHNAWIAHPIPWLVWLVYWRRF